MAFIIILFMIFSLGVLLAGDYKDEKKDHKDDNLYYIAKNQKRRKQR